MSIGAMRNRPCPHGHTHKIKVPAGTFDIVLKYKKCCWDKDYWAGWNTITKTVLDKKTNKEIEITKHIAF